MLVEGQPENDFPTNRVGYLRHLAGRRPTRQNGDMRGDAKLQQRRLAITRFAAIQGVRPSRFVRPFEGPAFCSASRMLRSV